MIGHQFSVPCESLEWFPLEVRFVESGAVDLTGDARVVFEGRLGAEATRGFS